MKSFDSDLKKYADKISLKVSERHELRERILSYMEYHPLKKQVFAREDLLRGIPSESFITLHVTAWYARVLGGVLILAIIVMPFIAERSVPGDVLYLLKTGFNEPIQGTLVSSPYKKIEFETKLMERRISEARLLANEGKLTEEVKSQIAETVKAHTVAVQDGLAMLRAQDADGAAIAEIAFNSSLEVQSAVLGANANVENASLIENILLVVNDAREKVVINQGESVPSFEGLMARVELETTRAYELFTAIKKSATAEEVRDIERRLSDIDRLVLEAKQKHTTEKDGVVNDLINTLGLIQKLIVFMTDINVRETVTLESIVPVVLSGVERADLVRGEIQNIENLIFEIKHRFEQSLPVAVQEKVLDGIDKVEELLLIAGTALETENLNNAETSIREARALASDLDSMTRLQEGEVTSGGVGEHTQGTSTPIVIDGETGTSTTPTLSATTTTVQ